MTTLGQNASLYERYKYAPETVTREEILDALETMTQWESAVQDEGFDDPKELCDDYKSKVSEIDDLQSEIADLQSEIADLQSEIADLQSEIDDLMEGKD